MTKTLRALVCALVLFGAVAVTPRTGAATPAQTVAATTATKANDAAAEGTSAVTADQPAATSNLSVSRLVVGTGVNEREPVGAASAFSLATTPHVYAFVEVANPNAEATTIELVWLDVATGKERRSYTLEIQAHKRWRTWARSAAPKQPGAWAVLVRDANGMELARTPYEVTE